MRPWNSLDANDLRNHVVVNSPPPGGPAPILLPIAVQCSPVKLPMLLVSRAFGLVALLAFLAPARPVVAQALVRVTNGDQGQSIQAADPLRLPGVPGEEDRLIESYRRQAGKLGPRRWFSEPKVVVRATVGEAFDDNILTSAARAKQADSVTTLGGGVRVSVGDATQGNDTFLVGDYQATATLFGIHDDENAVDQAALVDVQYRWDKLVVRGTSRFQSLHDTSPDLGRRTQRYVFDESLDLRYHAGAYTRLEGAVKYAYSDYDGPIDTQDASINLGADYLFFDKLRLGGGLVYGHLEANGGVNENYEQVEARLEYEATGRIRFRGRFGFEVRQRGGGDGDEGNPVFSLEGDWTPFDGSLLTLTGYRRVSASASLVGEDIIETGLHFSLRQRLVARFYVQLDAEYTHAEYQSATDAAAAEPRTDDYYLVRGAVGYDFVEWCKAQVYCQRRQDDSTRDEFSFDSTRAGVQVDFAY